MEKCFIFGSCETKTSFKTPEAHCEVSVFSFTEHSNIPG